MLFLAVVFALWEIQIEGKDGWAAKAPCWKIEKKWVVRLMGGKPLTGYYFYMNVMMLSFLHLTLFFFSWTCQLEALFIGFYLVFLLIDDFLWFVLNPAFGIKNFKPGKIWWHPNWWGPFPDFYWIQITIATVLIWLGSPAI